MSSTNLLSRNPKLDSLIEPANKGLGEMDRPLSSSDIAKLDWNLLREDLSLPVAVLYEEKLMHNLQWMQQFIASYGLKLAPHGKTTMAPKLFALQLQSGAWGITLATAHQTRVAYEHGVRRVLMANQLVGRQNMSTVAELLQDSDFEYFCLIDSARQVEQLGAFFHEHGKKLSVLIELGVEGGRTGIRNPFQLQSLLDALKLHREHIVLSGIEIYEGILEDEASVRHLLQEMIATTRRLAQEKLFDRTPIVLSGAGSAWYDVVAEELSRANLEYPVELVLRPGCYLTHDVGIYRKAQEKIQERNPVAQAMRPGLLPALQLWAYVQSVPEKTKAIIGLGKRDAAFDAGLPTPAGHYRPGISTTPLTTPAHWQLTRMMDQHAYLQIAEGDDIAVGDMIAFDISHPCLTFDKWRTIPVVDDSYRVIDVVQTFF
jgi:D-serine deaminase-like pyridoxal phosphate-dependent protein